MSNEYIGVIRRGWQEATTTLAPHVVGLDDILEQRLEEAIRTGNIDETTLLAIVDAATQMAVDSGAADVAHSLSKRLRRTVYEYLLSLDATSPAESAPLPQVLAVSPSGAMLIGADEVAALGRVAGLEPSTRREQGEKWVDFSEPAWAAGLGKGSSSPTASSRLDDAPGIPETRPPEPEPSPQRRLYLFQGDGDVATQTVPDATPDMAADHDLGTPSSSEAAPDEASASAAVSDEARLGAPSPGGGFGFHIGDPNDLVGQAPPGEDESANPDDQNFHAFPADLAGFDSVTPGRDELPPPPRASFADPSTWPKPVAPTLRSLRSQEPVEPRSDASEPSGSHGAAGFEHLSRWSSPWPNRLLADPIPEEPGAAEPVMELPALAEPQAEAVLEPSRPAAAARPAERLPLAPARSEQPQPSTPAVSQFNTPLDVEEVPESDLSELRAAIDEKLRKKRCDDAAAMLQQVAQEVGGRLVAEMALDAGDRCRALGKANAALNCYLAASRADPVYEAPLARLADICIDDQDIDLAVSYLERIARLTRLRGDNKGSLRIYRKIATIAPYRDDVLEMLMRAQTTGRFDS